MAAFLGSFIEYAGQMVLLVALAVAGGFIGVKLRERKNAADAVSDK